MTEATPEAPQLRGATVRGRPTLSGRRALIATLAVIAASLALVLNAYASDYQRVSDMRTNGVQSTLSVSSCIGNLGGSGSNGAGYTCTGTYRFNGSSLSSTLADWSSFVAPQTRLCVDIDPRAPHFVVTCTEHDHLATPQPPYVAIGLLGVALVATLTGLWRGRRRGANAKVATP